MQLRFLVNCRFGVTTVGGSLVKCLLGIAYLTTIWTYLSISKVDEEGDMW